MSLHAEIREKLAQLLLRRLDLESREDRLAERSWILHLECCAGAQELSCAVELALFEHAGGSLSEKRLRRELRSLLP